MDPAREELAAELARMADEGLSVAELAEATGQHRQRVLRLLHAARYRLARTGTRRIVAELTPADFITLRLLADRAGVSVREMMRRVVLLTIQDGVDLAARKLGSLAQRKRAYRRRREEVDSAL